MADLQKFTDAQKCAIFKSKLLLNESSAGYHLLRWQPYLISPEGKNLNSMLNNVFDSVDPNTSRLFFDTLGLFTPTADARTLEKIFEIPCLANRSIGWYAWVVRFQPHELVRVQKFICGAASVQRTVDHSIIDLFRNFRPHFDALLSLLPLPIKQRWEGWISEFTACQMICETNFDYLYEHYGAYLWTYSGDACVELQHVLRHPQFPDYSLQCPADQILFNVLSYDIWPVASAEQIRGWKSQMFAAITPEHLASMAANPYCCGLMQAWRFD